MTVTTVALSTVESIPTKSNKSIGNTHLTVWEHGHLGYKEYTSELLPELLLWLSSGTTMSSGHLSTGERLSDDVMDGTKTLHRSSHLASSVLRHFIPFQLSLINLIPSASAFFITSVYLQLPAKVSIIFEGASLLAAHRRDTVCSSPSIAAYFASYSHLQRYRTFLFSYV